VDMPVIPERDLFSLCRVWEPKNDLPLRDAFSPRQRIGQA